YRNATIVDATDSSVTVTLPTGLPGGGDVDVAVVTDEGQVVADDAFHWTVPAEDLIVDEVASVALVRLDCPVDIDATLDTETYPLLWCGLSVGEAFASGWIGLGQQQGTAGELADLGRLSILPAVG